MADHEHAATAAATKSPIVAIVEDDDEFRKYLSVLFETSAFRVEQASCGRELFAILAAQHVDCVILDYNLASENGLSIHAQIKGGVRDAPPIVMLTSERDERTIIKAFRDGISDYVLKKDMRPEELFKAVNGAIERQQRARARAQSKSEYDDATGLYSRASIDKRLAGIAKNPRAASSAVMLITVDNLQDVRERYGQTAADQALRSFVARLKKALGPSDISGRYDDARFILVIDVDARFKTLEFACRRLAREVSFDTDAAAVRLTASIGAAIRPPNGNTMDAVVAAAEQALKNARAQGIPYAIA